MPWVNTSPSWYGMREMTAAKMMIDMPLPMPRWVMSSPSHITSAVPAVHVMTISNAFHAVKFGMKSTPCGRRLPERPKRPALPLLSANTKPVDCTSARATVR